MACFEEVANAALVTKKDLDLAHEMAEKSNASNPVVDPELKLKIATEIVLLFDFDSLGVLRESEIRRLVKDLRDAMNFGTVSPGQDKPLRMLLKRAESKKSAIPVDEVADALACGLPMRQVSFDEYSALLHLDASRARETYRAEKDVSQLSIAVRELLLHELHADFDIDRTGYITEQEIFDIAQGTTFLNPNSNRTVTCTVNPNPNPSEKEVRTCIE